MLRTIEVALAVYLLLLALSAAWGVHRPLLLFPARIFYSLLQLALFLFSFGRIRLLPLARRSGVYRQSLRQAADDLQEVTLPEIKDVSWRKDNEETPS